MTDKQAGGSPVDALPETTAALVACLCEQDVHAFTPSQPTCVCGCTASLQAILAALREAADACLTRVREPDIDHTGEWACTWLDAIDVVRSAVVAEVLAAVSACEAQPKASSVPNDAQAKHEPLA